MPQKQPMKSANVDLLSDIDFSGANSVVSTPPLQPMTKKPEDARSDLGASSILHPTTEMSPMKVSNLSDIRKLSVDNLSICSDVSSIDAWESASAKLDETPKVESTEITAKFKDPFEDPKVLKWFHKEVERLERFIETSTVKTLNGTTPLDGKWKELQDLLVRNE